MSLLNNIHQRHRAIKSYTKKAERELSSRNFTLFKKFDEEMVRVGLANTSRCKGLQHFVKLAEFNHNKDFENVQKVHHEFPDKNLIFTEGTQEGGPHIGSWDLGERYARSIINDLNRWTVAWLDWNLILDGQGGPNHVGNFCSAPIIVDNNEILFQSSYYYIGHFSRYIKRGDYIIHSEINSDDLLSLSAMNKSGTIKTVVMNDNDTSREFELIHNNSSLPLSIPSHSIITIIIK